MALMNYLARHSTTTKAEVKIVSTPTPTAAKTTTGTTLKHSKTNKRSLTLPTVLKKKKEIGDYILCRTIGRGASGRVKLGIHKQTGEKVAIKMISRSQLVASSTTAKSVQRELAVLQLLHHPHLIDLRQVLQDTTNVYFVMEYLEGGELFHVLAERGKLPESEARLLFIQLITALHWCHAHHISHRDLKPENILLDKEKKNIKIADFGMAAMQPTNALLKTSCGSPHYASPEIVRGKRYDGRATDVWSCGAILYAMITGHLPFDDEYMGRLLAKIKTGRYRALPDYISPDAKDLIKRMLVVDPTKRMTMAEILNHPWLTNKSFLGTELRFLQQNIHHNTELSFNPLSDPELESPLIHKNSRLELDGRIWETLKVLWREKTEDEIISLLSSQGPNIQKLTCKLLQERSWRLENQQQGHPVMTTAPENNSSISLPLRRSSVMTDDVPMTPPLRSIRRGSEDVESYLLNATPYETSSIDTMSACCYRTQDLPPTPNSITTNTFQQLINSSDSSVTVNHITDYQHPLKKKPFLPPWDQNGDSYYSCINSPILMQQQQNRRRSSLMTSSMLSTNTTNKYWVHDDNLSLAQTEEKTRGCKSDAADVFVMTNPVEINSNSSYMMHEQYNNSTSLIKSSNDTWWLCSKPSSPSSLEDSVITPTSTRRSNWFDKALDYLFVSSSSKKNASTAALPQQEITIECFSKDECETAGKLHQVLEECFDGKLTGRMYPHGKIVWSGIINKLTFTCNMSKINPTTLQIKLVSSWSFTEKFNIMELIDCLNRYETESDWVTRTNGWVPEIL